MNNQKNIDDLLRKQTFSTDISSLDALVYNYAESIAKIEKCVVVVSDLKFGTSRIFSGAFANQLGLTNYTIENSIWEKEILTLMTPEECNEKYLAELRFFNFLRHIPRHLRENYYLATTLRMFNKNSKPIDVLHRMYYRYETNSDVIRYGICLYGPDTFSIPAKSIAIDSVTGHWEELSSVTDNGILSHREKQVLALIEQGMTSQAIASDLCISKHTVSRHRQEILAKLQARNSTEACRRAKQLKII